MMLNHDKSKIKVQKLGFHSKIVLLVQEYDDIESESKANLAKSVSINEGEEGAKVCVSLLVMI